MIYVINKENRHLFKSTIEKMHVLRYELFIRERNWSLPTQDNREEDQFDHEDAVYLVYLEPNGDVTGTGRLIPSTSSHMLNEVFADLCDGPVPIGPQYWEISRGGVKDVPHREEIWKNLSFACFEYCHMQGGEYLTLVTDLYIYKSWLANGALITPLGEPVKREDGTFIAAKSRVTNEWLIQSRTNSNLTSPSFNFVREEFTAI